MSAIQWLGVCGFVLAPWTMALGLAIGRRMSRAPDVNCAARRLFRRFSYANDSAGIAHWRGDAWGRVSEATREDWRRMAQELLAPASDDQHGAGQGGKEGRP